MTGSAPFRQAGRLRAVLRGALQPIVVVLLLIAFFTTISGKPLDGVLMLVAGAALAWDAGRPDRPGPGPRQAGRPPIRRPLAVSAFIAAVLLYAVAVGSFARYSWPVTVAVVAVGAAVVVIGWRGPAGRTRTAGPVSAAGAVAWGAVLVAGGLWELWSLLHQPTLTTASYAHPTISVLTDPLLASAPGRALVLAAWLALGWYLVER